MTLQTPHKDKLLAAINNPKCGATDLDILKQCLARYEKWISEVRSLRPAGKERVQELTALLNTYKDEIEVELIMKSQSPFLIRQKGQLKLDNSIIEEFLVHLINPRIMKGLPEFSLEIGPQTAFMSLAFTPSNLSALGGKPPVEVKEKDADFALGRTIHYKFSPEADFTGAKTTQGKLVLAVLAAECKVNLDKTMFQEAAGTAARLKQGCPMSRYYVLVEYLDMEPEDCRLTAIDNVFLLRHARRLPFGKRTDYQEVRAQHRASPIDPEVVWGFCQEIQSFLGAVWYDPAKALERGTFV